MIDKLTIEIDTKYIYDKLNSIDNNQKALVAHVEKQNGRVTKNEKRIGKMEKVHWKQAAFISGVVATVTVISNYI